VIADLARVQQEEASGSISVGFARRQQAWPKAQPADPESPAITAPANALIAFTVTINPGWSTQAAPRRNAEGIEELLVPFERLDIHEKRSRCIGDVSAVFASQLPDNPAVDRPKESLAVIRSSP
jgi:hypothetical protein